jgi:hypothetical protein
MAPVRTSFAYASEIEAEEIDQMLKLTADALRTRTFL